MNKICVYTCITGEYDDLKEIKNKEKNIDYYCFTNNRNIKSNTWKVVYINNCGVDDHRLARKIKILGHPIIFKYDISVWQDASVRFKTKINYFIKEYFDLDNDALCIPKHYCRKSVNEEALECIRLKKDSKDIILKQMDFYKREKFNDDLGLFETTVFIRNNNCKLLNDMSKIWYDMIEKYSKRDQLSLTFASYKTGLQIKPIDIVVWNNDWFDTVPHKSYGKTYNIYYSSNNDGIYDKMDVYYYKKKNEYIMIDFKPKKNNFKICVAEVKNMLCSVIKSNCILNCDNSFNYNNNYFSNNDFVFLFCNNSNNKRVKIVIKLEKISVQVNEILIEMKDKMLDLSRERNYLENEIRKIENSSSWKITKPLRCIKKFIRK